MLLIGQSRMDRIPLNPWFEVVGFRYISYADKHLGGMVEGSKLGSFPCFIHRLRSGGKISLSSSGSTFDIDPAPNAPS
jgi:hypothetical protein